MIALSLIAISLSAINTNPEPFITKAVDLPHIQNALLVKHRNRALSGGFSAMWLSDDCKTTWLISDYSQVAELELKEQPVLKSRWFETKNTLNSAGQIVKLEVVSSGQLKGLDGEVLSGAAESIVWFNGSFLLSLDYTGDLLKYTALDDVKTKPASRTTPEKIRSALNSTPTIAFKQPQLGKGNAGLESISVLPSGEIVSIWEKYQLDDITVPMQVIDYNGVSNSLSYKAISSPKDMTTLKSGEVIILEKDWLGKEGSRLRLAMLVDESIKNKSEFTSRTLFDKTDIKYDNFEAMASCISNDKEWLYLISDDNGDWHTKDVEEKGRERQKTLFIGFDVGELLNTK